MERKNAKRKQEPSGENAGEKAKRILDRMQKSKKECMQKAKNKASQKERKKAIMKQE